MSPRVLLRIALALVFALGLWLALNLFGPRTRDEAGHLTLPALSAGAVERITVAGAADSLMIVKRGDAWQVDGMPALAKAVREFLEASGDSTAESELIAQSTGSHARLGVDSATGRRLTIVGGGKTLLDLVVGHRGPELDGFYVRRAGAPEVHLLRGRFAELLARSENDWRDRQLAAVRADSIAKVEVRRGRAQWTLSRVGASWSIGNRPADSMRVARFLSIFSDLRATGFPDRSEGDSITFAPPERAVTLSGADGQPILALVFDSTASGAFWVRPAAGGPVYRLDGRTTSLVTPEESSLRK